MTPRFELRRLETYEEESLLAEIRRVGELIDNLVITQAQFNLLSKASSSSIRKRFGTWENALARAGLAGRYSGRPVSKRLQVEPRRFFTNEELIAELKSIAAGLGESPLTIERFNQNSTKVHGETVRRRFGSWSNALDHAGLRISNRGRRYSEADYFENLLALWTHYGRQPSYGEMDRSPSRIPSGAYEARWGTWRNALRAFIARVTSDLAVAPNPTGEAGVHTHSAGSDTVSRFPQSTESASTEVRSRAIRLGLRYDVLRRDHFRCVLCGASPATRVGSELHVDHIIPISRGGSTEPRNLRTLCSHCNIGKGAKTEQI